MKVKAQDAAGPPPPPLTGRPQVYPYATMAVGQFFFVAGKSHNSVGSYAYNRGRELGRKFATRIQWMRLIGGEWADATEGDPGAVKGVGVYRTE